VTSTVARPGPYWNCTCKVPGWFKCLNAMVRAVLPLMGSLGGSVKGWYQQVPWSWSYYTTVWAGRSAARYLVKTLSPSWASYRAQSSALIPSRAGESRRSNMAPLVRQIRPEKGGGRCYRPPTTTLLRTQNNPLVRAWEQGLWGRTQILPGRAGLVAVLRPPPGPVV